MLLYQVSTSPFADHKLAQCIARLQSSDGLILTQDAVYAIHHPELLGQLSALPNCYVLQDDLAARGLELNSGQIKQVSYADFVALSLKYNQVIRW